MPTERKALCKTITAGRIPRLCRHKSYDILKNEKVVDVGAK